jgi:hypothetical protein
VWRRKEAKEGGTKGRGGKISERISVRSGNGHDCSFQRPSQLRASTSSEIWQSIQELEVSVEGPCSRQPLLVPFCKGPVRTSATQGRWTSGRRVQTPKRNKKYNGGSFSFVVCDGGTAAHTPSRFLDLSQEHTTGATHTGNPEATKGTDQTTSLLSVAPKYTKSRFPKQLAYIQIPYPLYVCDDGILT